MNLLHFSRALYYECKYQQARKGLPITREWVAGCVPILINAPRDEAAYAAAQARVNRRAA